MEKHFYFTSPTGTNLKNNLLCKLAGPLNCPPLEGDPTPPPILVRALDPKTEASVAHLPVTKDTWLSQPL